MNNILEPISHSPVQFLSTLPTNFASEKYTIERSFCAAKFEEVVWDKLLANDAESYRYHLAFEGGKIEGFKTGYIAVKRGGVIVSIAPYFITDYRLDTTVQGALKNVLVKVQKYLPKLFSLRILCVGSPVTDSCKFGINPDIPFDADMLEALNVELEKIALREKVSVIAFKDVIEKQTNVFRAPLKKLGYTEVANMPVASNLIQFASLDEYLNSLSYSMRKNLRRKRKSLQKVRIEEYDGAPPDMNVIHALYLNTYEKSETKFEKLTLDFFESMAGLMPNNTRFVLYYVEDQLIAFNCLLYRNGVMLDKYIGMDETLAKKHNIYFLSWLHNIEMCIRDGFHTFQSGQASYETKLRLGAELTPTAIFFKHTNIYLNQPLKLLSRVLAYANFDQSVQGTITQDSDDAH